MKQRKLLGVLLILALAFTMTFGSIGTAAAASHSGTQEIFEKTGDYIYETIKTPAYGSIGGEWVMYGFGLADYEVSDDYVKAYQASVEAAVKEGYRGTPGMLHDRKYTEYSRVIVAYAAMGLDPTNIAGYDMVGKLADFDKVIWQGLNGPIWALRALDAGDYEIAKSAKEGVTNVTTRQKLVDYLVENQLANGGWGLQPKEDDPAADVDITGMALTALAPYYKQAKVKTAINDAVKYLSEEQEASGGYTAWGSSSSETIAQAICGLTAVGINPNSDKRFVKNGNSLVDALLTFYDAEVGGFRHVNTASGGYEATVNQMATEQAYYALGHYFNTVPAKASLSKVTTPKSKSMKITWKKADPASGYQITYATNSKFTKNVKKVTVSGQKSTSKTLKSLKSGKTYYVKVRAYKTVGGKKVYGLYSSVKKIKVK